MGENLSIVIGFPPDVVAELNPVEDKLTWWEILLAIGGTIVFFLFYIFLPFILLVLWWKKGRDPKVNPGPRAWFDLPKHISGRDMGVGEVGVIVDERIDPRDVSGTILALAIKKYLVIEQTGKGKDDYKFVIRETDLSKLTEFEKAVYESIFKGEKDEVTLKSLQTTFYTKIQSAKKELYQSITTDGYFEANPESVRTKYVILAVIAFFFLNFFLGVVLLIFSVLMPKKTVLGAEKKEEALALKRFLETQDRQLEFQENNWYFFEKLLPYAIAFGVAKVWAKKFQDLQVPSEIDWYRGNNLSHLAVLPFVNNLTTFTQKAETMSGVPYSNSRSSSGFSSGFSGGGFSGGGGGGGGGGSW